MASTFSFPSSSISIHALREEGDSVHSKQVCEAVIFLSTPSARRATKPASRNSQRQNYFYPRPPRGGRLCPLPDAALFGIISIHALREEGDPLSIGNCNAASLFLSTPSARRATVNGSYSMPCSIISIHALREEGDSSKVDRADRRSLISIHALREEGDKALGTLCRHKLYFYPRPPRGGRRHWHIGHKRTLQFLSTPSARRATVGRTRCASWRKKFLSTPSARRATMLPGLAVAK